MQAKRKKKKTIIIRTTQPKAVRLGRAKAWLPTYTGKNVVKGYARKYGVDLLCAIAELRLLGVEITTEYELAVCNTVAQKIAQNRLKKEAKKETAEIDELQGGDFEFIAGYTTGGMPYGIRNEDIEEK